MKKGISRKINLQKYGGNQYESVDFWIESEDETISHAQLTEVLEEEIKDFIIHLPKQLAVFEKAKNDAHPFVSKGEINGKSI